MRAAAKQPLKIKIEGYLQRLMKQAFDDRSVFGGERGSGGGTRTPDPRIMIPVL